MARMKAKEEEEEEEVPCLDSVLDFRLCQGIGNGLVELVQHLLGQVRRHLAILHHLVQTVN